MSDNISGANRQLQVIDDTDARIVYHSEQTPWNPYSWRHGDRYWFQNTFHEYRREDEGQAGFTFDFEGHDRSFPLLLCLEGR